MENSRVRIVMSPANRADAGNEAKPIDEQNEDEDRGKEPERLFHQVTPNHALEKIVKALDKSFPEVLQTFRDGSDFSRSQLRADNDPGGHNPGDDH